MAKLLHVRLPAQLVEGMQRAVDAGRYSTISEFVKDAVRKSVDDYETRYALYLLEKNRGIAKGKVKRLTEKQREKIAEDLVAGKYSDIFRKYGLD